jgi:Na+/glutamate symporter
MEIQLEVLGHSYIVPVDFLLSVTVLYLVKFALALQISVGRSYDTVVSCVGA